jgi:hypothetical protein
MNQSIYIHSHVETPHGVKRLNGGGIWRFRPETLELEVFCPASSTRGGTTSTAGASRSPPTGPMARGSTTSSPARSSSPPRAKRIVAGLNPGSPKHCGLEIVSGRHFLPEWHGNMITNDFRATASAAS